MDLIWQGLLDAVQIVRTGDYSVWQITLRSLLISGSAVMISLVLGILAGAFLAFKDFHGRNVLLSLVNTGMGLPPVVVGLMVAIFLWRQGMSEAVDLNVPERLKAQVEKEIEAERQARISALPPPVKPLVQNDVFTVDKRSSAVQDGT